MFFAGVELTTLLLPITRSDALLTKSSRLFLTTLTFFQQIMIVVQTKKLASDLIIASPPTSFLTQDP